MQSFNCEFVAFDRRGIRVKLFFKSVRAPDTYQASDKIKQQIPNYSELRQPSFLFKLDRKQMPAYLSRVVAGAGAEES